jgi:hypothetical protein
MDHNHKIEGHVHLLRSKLKSHVQYLLLPDEVIEKTFMQRRLAFGGSLTNPMSILATNKRLFIIRSTTMGIRKMYEIIPYEQIVNVMHRHGIFSSTVSINMKGYHKTHDLPGKHLEEGEIDGLRNSEADELVEYLGKQIAPSEKRRYSEMPLINAENSMGAYVYCTSCGNKSGIGAAYCKGCGAKLSQ